MSEETDYAGQGNESLTLREWADGQVAVIVHGEAVSPDIQSFTFGSPEELERFARHAARAAGLKLATDQELPTVHVAHDGVHAGDGDSRVRASLEPDIGWLQTRAGELREQIEHLTGQYRNTLAIEQWRRGVIEQELETLAREYFGPDLDALPAGSREIVRDLRLARNRIAELTKPRPRWER